MAEDVTFGKPTTLRGRLGRAGQWVVPNLDQRAFFQARKSDVRARSGDYLEFIARNPATVDAESIHRHLDRPIHVVVVPDEGLDFDSWGPGHRNFYFEAAQSLSEKGGEAAVSVFSVPRGEPSSLWHTRLLDYLRDVGATHVLTHIESDPGTEARSWTWDSAWPLISERWDGVLLGVMFDSAYRHTLLKGRYLARISPRFMLVDICMPMDGQLVRGRPEVGPVNMPMSDQSLALVDARLARVETEYDVSFVGVLYDYRVDLINALRAQGLEVAVNPHRGDGASDRTQTLVNQPGWLEYMAALAGGRSTLNFAESAARPVEQLKTRVIEAGLARTFLFTDDRDRTSRFWRPGREYSEFATPADLPRLVASWLSDDQRLASARESFATRARWLARFGFWSQLDAGLRLRALPEVGVTAPAG